MDDRLLDARLRAIAPRIVRTAAHAVIKMDAGDQPAIVPDVPGIALDLSASRTRIA